MMIRKKESASRGTLLQREPLIYNAIARTYFANVKDVTMIAIYDQCYCECSFTPKQTYTALTRKLHIIMTHST